MCTSEEMARHVIRLSQEVDAPVDNLSLQHILLEIQDGSQAGDAAHFDDKVVRYGSWPVYPKVYKLYSSYAGRPITAKVEDIIASRVTKAEDDRIKSVIERWARGIKKSSRRAVATAAV